MGTYTAVTPGGIINKVGFDLFDDHFQEHLTPRQYSLVKFTSRTLGLVMDYKLVHMLLTPEKVTIVRTMKMRSIINQWKLAGRLTIPGLILYGVYKAGKSGQAHGEYLESLGVPLSTVPGRAGNLALRNLHLDANPNF